MGSKCYVRDRDKVEAIALSHLPTMKLFENCCRNAVLARIPCIGLIHHANCQRLLRRARMVLPILAETSDTVAPRIHTRFALREFVAPAV
jgi:hypothetical protein